MRVLFLLPLLALVSAKTKINPNTVNLALETSLIFDGDNTKKDLSFIDGLQVFLDKLKSYLKLREQSSFRSEKLNDGIFTEFFKDFSRIIINYDNEALKNITDALALIMEPQYYKGTTFHEMIKDDKLKSFIKDKIMDWADTDPKILKYQMAVAVMSKESTPLTEFGSYLNKFFNEKDSKKLKKLLKKFNNHENPSDMHKLVKKALGFLIFHRFKKLNETEKNELANAIKRLTDFLIEDTSKNGKQNEYSTHKHNRTLKNSLRRSQIKINSLLPQKIVLQNNVEFNVKTPGREESKVPELVADTVTEHKATTKSVNLHKWEKVPYMSVEMKLNEDQHIAIETKEHATDTIIIDTKHRKKKRNKKKELNLNTTLEMRETEATTIETSTRQETKAVTTGSEDSTHFKDMYKHIMSINIEGDKKSATTNTHTERNNDKENKNDDTEALAQNSEEKANITKDIETKSAQDETLNKTSSPKDESKDKNRRMGVSLPKSPADIDVAVIDAAEMDTEELKMKIYENPHESVTVAAVLESSSQESQEATYKRQDDIVDSDKEEYQHKIADGAKKIRNLLDNAIAMKLLGIT